MKFVFCILWIACISVHAQTINNGLYVNEERNEFVIIKNDTVQFRHYNDDAFATYTLGEGVLKRKEKFIIHIGVLVDIKESKKQYVLRDSLNFLELEVPEWFNVFKPMRNNMFWGAFPERHGVINAMSMIWEYKIDFLSFNDFVNKGNLIPKEKRPNYRLIEENDSVLRYFYTIVH